MHDFRLGLMLPLEALRLLRRERRFWKWLPLPALVNFLALVLAAALFLSQLDWFWSLTVSALPAPGGGAWYTWIWIGPLWALVYAARAVAMGLLAALVTLAAVLIGAIVAAPVNEVLSVLAEEAHLGRRPQEGGLLASLGQSVRMMAGEAQRVLVFALLQAAIWAMGLVPFLQLLAVPLAIAVAIVFLPVEYTSWAMDRRGRNLRQRRDWLFRNLSAAVGFGMAAFVLLLIPLANLLCVPILVIGGTLLAVETEEARATPAS